MRRFQQRVLTNLHLGLALLALILVQSALLLGLVVGDPLRLERSPFRSAGGGYEDYLHCSSAHQQSLYPAAIMSFRFALLAVTAVYAFRIRNIPDEFSKGSPSDRTRRHGCSMQMEVQTRTGHHEDCPIH